MTKRELVIQVAEKLGMTQHEVANVVQTMFDTVTDTLVEGNRLEIRNFGVFEVKKRDARMGRNPRTGEEVPIPQKSVAFFKPGKVLKQLVQGDTADGNLSSEHGGEVKADSEGDSGVQQNTSSLDNDSTAHQQNLF